MRRRRLPVCLIAPVILAFQRGASNLCEMRILTRLGIGEGRAETVINLLTREGKTSFKVRQPFDRIADFQSRGIERFAA